MAEVRRKKITVTSKEFLYIDGVRLFDPRSPDGDVDPTGIDLYVAFLRSTDDMPADGSSSWKTAEWTPGEEGTSVRYLHDPTALGQEVGKSYDVALRGDGGVEMPRERVGTVQVIR